MAPLSGNGRWSLLFLALALFALSDANPRKPQKMRKAEAKGWSKFDEFKKRDIPSTRAIEEYLLPTALVPVTQFNRLQPFVNGNGSIIGYTEITFNCDEATSSIILHMSPDMTVDEASVTLYDESDPSVLLGINSFNYEPDKHFWTASLTQSLTAGSTYVITMDFEGVLQSDINGLFIASYQTSTGDDVYYAATQFEPNGARFAFPCFDEPSFKATFTTELVREEGMMSASNMPLQQSGQTPGQNGWVSDLYMTSEIMSSYLNSFLVSDFGYMSLSDGDILYKTYARDEMIYSAEYGLNVTAGTINFFEAYFSIDYPMPKLDSNALPEFFSGAMENWGLMNYIDWLLLYDPQITPASIKESICSVIAHEVGHDWFGNLITCEWWDYIWINEGNTEFICYKGCDSVEPTMKVLEQFVSGVLQSGLEGDDSTSAHPLVFNITHPSEANSVFDGTTYNKGSSLVRMMEYFLTEATLNPAMTTFLNTYAYDNADQDQYFAIIDDQAKADGTLDPSLTVKQVMDTWTLQAGFPVLTVTRNTDGTATLTQERFLMNSTGVDTSGYSWYIPVTFTTQSAPDFDSFVVDWMLESELQKTISGMPPQGEWVIFNIQHGGFFRVNYDESSWNDIITQLDTDYTVIHEMNRVQIIADAFNMAKSGRATYTIALGTSNFMQNEVEYSVLDIGMENLFYIDAMFRTGADYDTLKNFLLALMVPTYERVGFDDDTNDPHTDQLSRDLSVTITCYLGHQDCLDSTTALFDTWMLDTDDYTTITPTMKDPTYCNGVGQGGQAEFDALYDRYLRSVFPLERDNLLYGMGCAQNVSIINSYLDMAFDASSGIRQSDVSYIMASISTTVVGESTAWDYIRANDDAISAYMGGYNFVESYVLIVTDNFNTDERLQELEQFRTDNAADIGPSGMVDAAIANCEFNIAWMDAYYNEVLTWLTDNGYGA